MTTAYLHAVSNSTYLHHALKQLIQTISYTNFRGTNLVSEPFNILWLKFFNLMDRQNEYDNEDEFWVTVKESGKKTESHTYEELQKEMEAFKKRLFFFEQQFNVPDMFLLFTLWMWMVLFQSLTRQRMILRSTLAAPSLRCWTGTQKGLSKLLLTNPAPRSPRASLDRYGFELVWTWFGFTEGYGSTNPILARVKSMHTYMINWEYFSFSIYFQSSSFLTDQRSSPEVYAVPYCQSGKASQSCPWTWYEVWWPSCSVVYAPEPVSNYKLSRWPNFSCPYHFWFAKTLQALVENFQLPPQPGCQGVWTPWKPRFRKWTRRMISAQLHGPKAKPKDSSQNSDLNSVKEIPKSMNETCSGIEWVDSIWDLHLVRLRFHTMAEQKMKAATYVSCPHRR